MLTLTLRRKPFLSRCVHDQRSFAGTCPSHEGSGRSPGPEAHVRRTRKIYCAQSKQSVRTAYEDVCNREAWAFTCMSQQRAVLSTYFANVRSILEYCSVVWGGAARTHVQRIERVQEKFLFWLCARCSVRGVPFTYRDLTEYSKVDTIAARHEQHDIMFIRNIHRHRTQTCPWIPKSDL